MGEEFGIRGAEPVHRPLHQRRIQVHAPPDLRSEDFEALEPEGTRGMLIHGRERWRDCQVVSRM